MTAQQPAYVLQASSHSAELFRRATQCLLNGAGVVGAGDLKVSQNTGTDLKCQIAAGQVFVPGTLGSSTGMPANRNVQSAYSPTSASFTTQGVYYGFNDAAITAVSFAAANATNPRIDLVVATVQDAGYSGATNNWVTQVVTGTAAGSPSAPAIPASSMVLAEVAIAANATSVVNANITDKRVFANTPHWYNVGDPSVPVFEHSWVNYGGGYSPVGYCLDNQGFVHLRGMAKSGSMGTVIFTLPAGFAPPYNNLFTITSNGQWDFLTVSSAGGVTADPGSGSNAYVSLDGISFSVHT